MKITVMMIGELDYGNIFYSASDVISGEYSQQVSAVKNTMFGVSWSIL